METDKELSAIQIVKSAGSAFRRCPWYCIFTYLLIIGIGIVSGTGLELIDKTMKVTESAVITLLVVCGAISLWLLGKFLKFGFKRSALKLADDKNPSYWDLLVPSGLGVRYITAWALFNLIVIGIPVGILTISLKLTKADPALLLQSLTGLILVLTLIGLSIFLALVFHLFPFVLIDQNAGIMESLQNSALVTRGALPQLVLFYVIIALLNAVGALFMGLGLLVTLPITAIGQARIYRRLLEQT